jgi:hypothetical protein
MIKSMIESWDFATRQFNADHPDDPLINPYAYVLEHGREYQMRPRPKGMRRRKGGACWYNAGWIALNSTYRSCEGFAREGVDLIAHAWLVDNEGFAIDPTWPKPEDCDYFGMIFTSEPVAQAVLRRTHWWSMIEYELMGRINANTATQADLEALPGIGPVLARRIVEGRPYRSVEELERVKGIGRKRLEEIRPLVTAD